MAIHIRTKTPIETASELDRRLTERTSTDFEATMWTGPLPNRTFDQRFPPQPAMPVNHPDLEVFKKDLNRDLHDPLQQVANDFWRRAIQLSNQQAVARYVANFHKQEEISEEQAMQRMTLFHDLDQAARAEAVRHDVLRRVSLLRAANFMLRMSNLEQRRYMEDMMRVRVQEAYEQERQNQLRRGDARNAKASFVAAREWEEREKLLSAMNAEVQLMMAKTQAALHYEAIRSADQQARAEERSARIYEHKAAYRKNHNFK